ncbi:hypothetical protein L6164_026205 [Bauhinia variegata]|uniref:Uncharacterized protein n=1 Tax=Bauhinia variegata TaxID=167791 RepID=A0ACB9LPK9_BAUVA|nr:hypothetical protein L6164_026205 [Bauhinia variegata]
MKAITTRRGTVVEPKPTARHKKQSTVEQIEKTMEEETKNIESEPEQAKGKRENSKKKKREEDLEKYNEPRPGTKLPFPQRFQKKNNEKNFSKFLEIFKMLHINIPIAEVLAQMLTYAKFMKDILANKRKLEEVEKVMLTKECLTIYSEKTSINKTGHGNFTIPCNIRNMDVRGALCDLGASMNLMPLSMFEKLGIGDIKPTGMTLQLVDRSLKCPYGVVENVLVKVDKYIFPFDFVVLDIVEDNEIPLIMGRSFLATKRALIDIATEKFKLSA